MPTCAQRGRRSLSTHQPPEMRRFISRSKDVPGRAHTFLMMGNTASVLLDEDEAESRPCGRCESGTRMGLCRRIDRFF
jgi:hypothetical protein